MIEIAHIRSGRSSAPLGGLGSAAKRESARARKEKP